MNYRKRKKRIQLILEYLDDQLNQGNYSPDIIGRYAYTQETELRKAYIEKIWADYWKKSRKIRRRLENRLLPMKKNVKTSKSSCPTPNYYVNAYSCGGEDKNSHVFRIDEPDITLCGQKVTDKSWNFQGEFCCFKCDVAGDHYIGYDGQYEEVWELPLS